MESAEIPPNLVLTSDLPRNVYQCDSCGTDISRTPRLRCAVCDDFDLCLDCGATAAVRHGHAYRVCDSTRYPLFPRGVSTKHEETVLAASEDPKSVWTAEEDLRLLRGIQTHGLGNWPDIAAEVVAGPGSSGKTAKRCMERYLDDFLGRYGYILPPHTLDGEAATESPSAATATDEDPPMDESTTPSTDEATRSSTRRSTILRNSPIHLASAAGPTSSSVKKYKAIPTTVGQNWAIHAPNRKRGEEVGRDLSVRSEHAFVRALASATDSQQTTHIRKEWERTRLNQPGGPTALPMKPTDVDVLPGSEIAGYMPRRGDFDIEWENEAEDAIADMEFTPGEPEADRELKLKVLKIYNSKLDEREKRKTFVISRKLFDLKQRQAEFERLPRDERDLVHRMRLFERFHTPEEHKEFLAKLLKAKRLRKEIGKLQMYRRIGIRTLEEAERYELDKARRQFHKQQQVAGANAVLVDDESSGPYWKQYKTSDRKIRKSVNRVASSTTPHASAPTKTEENSTPRPDEEAKKPPPTEPAATEETPTTPKDTPATPMEVEPTTEPADAEKQPPATPDSKSNEESKEFLLSDREMDLCKSVGLQPNQYLDVKRALISESLAAGLVGGKGPGRSNKKLGSGLQRSLVQIDVERRGPIIDFVVSAGWIPSPLGERAATEIQKEEPEKMVTQAS